MNKYLLFIASFFLLAINPLIAVSSDGKKVILVLGSGGNKGIAHVGVIEELESLGITPDIIVGCSAGSIVGALYAQHRDIGRVKKILIDLDYDDLIDFNLFQKGAFSTRKKMEDFLKRHLSVKDFESLKLPLIAVTTDLNKGEPVYFREGQLHPILLASSALPGLFPPYRINDETYVDGGICDPLPTRFAKSLEEGHSIVIAVDISPSLDGFKEKTVLQILRKSFEVIYQRLAHFERQEADVLLRMSFPARLDSPFVDGEANREIYERGKEVVREQADKIKSLFFGSDEADSDAEPSDEDESCHDE